MAETNNKRERESENIEEEVPESKRIREGSDFLLYILDDESEPDNTDFDSVMRSLEEEITIPIVVSDPDPKQPDLGFLLEASDDELGLPPQETAEEDVIAGNVSGYGEFVDVEAEEVGFSKIWGLDDEIHLDFGGFRSREDNEEDTGSVIFDGGLFDFDGGVCGAQDFSDLTWQPEFLPAV